MRRALALVLLLGGCGPTLEEIRAEPARFTIKASVGWERMSTCLKAAHADEYSIVDLPISAERRTELVLYITGAPGQRIGMSSFELQGEGDSSTSVTWRRRKLIANQESFEAAARATVERCGRP